MTPKDAAGGYGIVVDRQGISAVAAAAGAVSSNHWSQFTTGAAYTRTQNGTFYYNGTRVWVTVTYDGYTGSHSCFTNYSVEFNLTGLQCNESGSTTSRSMYSLWEVNPNGTPIYYDVSMTAVLSKTGTISGYGKLPSVSSLGEGHVLVVQVQSWRGPAAFSDEGESLAQPPS